MNKIGKFCKTDQGIKRDTIYYEWKGKHTYEYNGDLGDQDSILLITYINKVKASLNQCSEIFISSKIACQESFIAKFY